MLGRSRSLLVPSLLAWVASFAVGLLVGEEAAAAEDYPTKLIRLLVPYPPGGSSDVAARIVAAKMSESLGQTVIVENKPGASNIIAIRELLRAPKDGYTLLVCTNVAIINMEVYKTKPYSLGDIAPISPMMIVPYSFSVSNKVPATNIKELISHIKANPGKLNYGTTGVGSTPDILSRRLESMWGLQMVGVPYQGSAPAVRDLVAGEIHLLLDPVITTMPLHKAGSLRSLGVTTEERLSGLPDVPTLREQGFPLDWGSWFGVCGSTGTPEPILEKVNAAVVEAVKSTDFVGRMNSLGAVAAPMTRKEFSDFIKKEERDWADMIRPLGIRLD